MILLIYRALISDKHRVPKEKYDKLKEMDIPSLDIDKYVTNKGALPKVIRRVIIKSPGLKAWSLTDKPNKETLGNLPEWTEIVYDNEKVEHVLKTFGDDHPVTKAYMMINPEAGVVKSDFARLVICYLYGGLYLDNKSYVKNVGLPTLPYDKDIWLSTWPNPHYPEIIDNGGEIINWYIYSRAGSNTLKKAIERVVFNINNVYSDPGAKDSYEIYSRDSVRTSILSITGPIMLTITVECSMDKGALLDMSINKYIEYIHKSCKVTNRNAHHSRFKTIIILSENSDINDPELQESITGSID
jgi:hypothetical protein